MHGSGLLDFQSHTLEHRYIPRWPEAVPLTGVAPGFLRYRETTLGVEDDFRLARQVLESELNKPVHHLAFPRFAGSAEAVRIGQACGYRSFWWGVQPGRPSNRPGDDGTRIVRLSGEFLRRLPGRGRCSLTRLLRNRYLSAVRRRSG